MSDFAPDSNTGSYISLVAVSSEVLWQKGEERSCDAKCGPHQASTWMVLLWRHSFVEFTGSGSTERHCTCTLSHATDQYKRSLGYL